MWFNDLNIILKFLILDGTIQEQCFNYLPVMRKNKVRMTRRVNPPTAAVAITSICPCSAAISEAEREAQREEDDAPSITQGFYRMAEIISMAKCCNLCLMVSSGLSKGIGCKCVYEVRNHNPCPSWDGGEKVSADL